MCDVDFKTYLTCLVDKAYDSRQAFLRAAEPDRSIGGASATLTRVLQGRQPPPLHTVPAYADALGLSGPERQYLYDLAAIEHLPADARPRFRALLEEVRRSDIRRVADGDGGTGYDT